MSHHLIPTADLAKLKAAIDWMKHPEALALLDALQPVEVVGHRNFHAMAGEALEYQKDGIKSLSTPLYGSKE